jgi:hypothetical protein
MAINCATAESRLVSTPAVDVWTRRPSAAVGWPFIVHSHCEVRIFVVLGRAADVRGDGAVGARITWTACRMRL